VDKKPGLLPTSASSHPRSRRFTHRRGGLPVAQAAKAVFLFSGLGAEHPAMGRGLFRLSDVFRGELERCDGLYRSITGSPLLVRRNPPFGERMRNGRPSYVQPAVFAFQYALAAAWIAWGGRPAAVFGYSLGEDAAACVAGAASLEDVMTLVVHRAQRMDALRGGGMAVLFAGAEQVTRFLAGRPQVEIAAANGADQTVVSGPAAAIDAMLSAASREHLRARRVRTGCAFHSSAMDRALAAIERDAIAPSFHQPATPLLSSVTGDWLSVSSLNDPTYWSGRVRAPIRFRDGLARLHAEGFRTFVEMGAHPMLLPLIRRDAAVTGSVCIETARRGEDDAVVTMAALSRISRSGASLMASMSAPRVRRGANPDAPVRRAHPAEVSR
jgi:acyl transferase domain-containing protein